MNGVLTTAEVAEMWGCSQQWVQALCKRGKLKAELKGKTYLVRERDAENYQHASVGRPPAQKRRKSKAR